MQSTAQQAQPSAEELQIQAMINEGGRVDRPSAAEAARAAWGTGGDESEELTSTVEPGQNWFKQKLEELSAKLGRKYVERIGKGTVSETLHRVPRRMRKVANQTELVLELIDDFRSGVYREVPWHTVAIASAGVLYAVSPADVVPDAIPFLGALDDLAVTAIAIRLVQKDLRRYCRFKGYAEEDYF